MTEIFIIENMRLMSSFCIIAAITLIAYVLHTAPAQHINLIFLDFQRILNKIRAADDYETIIDCAYDIEQFEHQHSHEERFPYYLNILNKEFTEAQHVVLETLSAVDNAKEILHGLS